MKILRFNEAIVKENWKIFAGLSGGFGGANFIKDFFGTRERAEVEAYQEAVQIYESYEGMHGLRTEQDIIEEDDVSEEEASEIYNEEMEGWLDYYVEPDNGQITERVKIFEEFINNEPLWNLFQRWLSSKDFELYDGEEDLHKKFIEYAKSETTSDEKASSIAKYLDDKWGLYDGYEDVVNYLKDLFSGL